jgi:small GTP-binding protein
MSTVGKTSISDVAATGHFSENVEPTIGIRNRSILVETKTHEQVELIIWDIAGGDAYRSISPAHFHSAEFCLLVFSLADRDSFDELGKNWVKTARAHLPLSVPLILVGNKSDLEENRVISHEEALGFEKSAEAIAYYETSARTGSGINELFARLGHECGSTTPISVQGPVMESTRKDECC